MHHSILKAVSNSNRRVMKKLFGGIKMREKPRSKHEKVNYCKERRNWMAITAVKAILALRSEQQL